MGKPSKNVFISSTSRDLQLYREIVKDTVLKLGMHPIMMEHFPAMDTNAVEGCRAVVKDADLFVGIYAHRYGFVPENQVLSITELEYNWAREVEIPVRLFVVNETYAWPPEHREEGEALERLKTFKERLGKEHIWSIFTSPESLAVLVSQSLARDLELILRQERRQRFINRLGLVAVLLLLVGVLGVFLTRPSDDTTNVLPTATASQVPTPQPMGAGFNVIVAGFGLEVQPNNLLVEDSIADDASDIIYGEIAQLDEVDHVLGWRDSGVGHVLDSTLAERQQTAQKLAESMGADVVIYGVVRQDGAYAIVEPEFYVAAEFAYEFPELGESGLLSQPVEYLRDSDDQPAQLADRISVIRLFLRGLSLYIVGDYSNSKAAFEQAAEIEPVSAPLFYVLAGNAALRHQDYDAALVDFGEALERRTGYARALVGRGVALFGKANLGQTGLPVYDATLALDEADCIIPNLPDERQALVWLALRCYEQAGESPDQPVTADIDVKVAFGQGEIYGWLALAGGSHWDEAEAYFQQTIDLYHTSDAERQVRTRYAAAHAYGWLGQKVLETNEVPSEETVELALYYYRSAVELLAEDLARQYNEHWIGSEEEDLGNYQQQIVVLENWLAVQSATPAPQPTK